MASAVIFGLALATVLTLVVVPTLYSIIYSASHAAERGITAYPSGLLGSFLPHYRDKT